MFKNQECLEHVVGSAAIGVAVGMLIQKMISPRSSEKPSTIANSASTIRYERVKKHSRGNNLQVRPHSHKHRRHLHHSRSKSSSNEKHGRNENGYLSISTHSLKKSKLSASESDLQSNLEACNDISESCNYGKLETIKNSVTMASNSANESQVNDKLFYNTFTEYLPIKDSKNTNTVKMDYNLNFNSESFASKSTEYLPIKLEYQKNLCDKAKDYKLNLHRESLANKSTEYLPFKSKDEKINCDTAKDYNLKSCRESFLSKEFTEYRCIQMKNNTKDAETVSLLFDISDRTTTKNNCNFNSSIDSLAEDEISNCSIVATCDTLEKDYNFD